MPKVSIARLPSVIDFDTAVYIHSLVDIEEPESRIVAANFVLQDLLGQKTKECKDVETAKSILRIALKSQLETDSYLIGATLCWGTTQFDSRPQSVRLIWDAMQKHPQLLIFGAGSLGKSYTAIAFSALDWERDPEFTTIKLASTTAGHERANTFSNLVRLHQNSAIPLSGYIRQGFIGLDKDNRRSSISEVTIDKGDENKSGKLQGFHCLPRPYPHPKFGTLTRVKGVFDEAEDIALGLWKGEANMMLNLDDEMHVSIVACWNPKRKDSMAAQKAEPEGGWANLDESLDEYVSRAGYHCIRLDARKCENVIQRKLVYPGLQTYEGFKRLEERGGADRDTFAYGIYPQEIASFGIVDPIVLDTRRGTFIWQTHPTPLAALDMAEEGGDEATYTGARYGPAVAFEPEIRPEQRDLLLSDPRRIAVEIAAKYHAKFEHVMIERDRVRIVFEHTRWVIQFDQQFPLEKKNTILMGADAIKMCQLLHVKPEWFGLDESNSVTLRNWMRIEWGIIQGFKWGSGATDMPILEEDQEKASDLFTNLKTEMWFALAAWVEFGYAAFAPSMDTAVLFEDLAGMRYHRKSKTMKECLPTKEFKKRFGGRSPDKGASAVMCIQVVRRNSSQVQRPQMGQGIRRGIESDVVYDPRRQEEPFFSESTGAADVVKWVP